MKHFQIYYELILQNISTKFYDLKMRLADFKQRANKNIANYLEKVASLVTKFPIKKLNIEITTIQGINDKKHQRWINQEYH